MTKPDRIQWRAEGKAPNGTPFSATGHSEEVVREAMREREDIAWGVIQRCRLTYGSAGLFGHLPTWHVEEEWPVESAALEGSARPQEGT